MEILNIVSVLSWGLLMILALKIIFFVFFSTRHHDKNKKIKIGYYDNSCPLVSIIVPCYNEGVTLENCITSLMAQDYKNIEIVIVDDGSTDNTKSVGGKISRREKKVRFFSKKNGGKASALNYGISRSTGSVVISIDADSMFLNTTVSNLISSFTDENVGGVGGNVKVANHSSFLGKHQAIEYITGLNLQRRAFAEIGCSQVISGAIGAFRKDALIKIGGYSSDTIVEDMDVCVSLIKAGYNIAFNGKAIAYTEAPESVTDFFKQRFRWTFGGFQVLNKHKDMIFNPKFGSMGMLGLPYFLLFPWIDVMISLLFFFAIVNAFLFGNMYGIIIFYLSMVFLQGILLYLALKMDQESKKFLLFSGLDGLWYNHIIGFITLVAGFKYLSGHSVTWNKLARVGITLPSQK